MKSILLAFVSVISLAGMASADGDPGSWFPDFDSLQQVQVAPSFQSRGYYLRLELQSAVERVAKQHDVAVYVVVTRQGQGGDDTAERLLSRMIHAWRQKHEFAARTYMVIVWMGHSNGGNGSMAVAIGEQVYGLGLGVTQLKQICEKSYNPDPFYAIRAALDKISDEIDTNRKGKTVSPSAMLLWLFTVTGVIAVLVTREPKMFWFGFWFVLEYLGGGKHDH